MSLRSKLGLILLFTGAPTLAHAGPLPCGWGGDDVGYVCGGEGADPSGVVPYECPGDLLEGDVCGDITYFGCCDDLGDNWWCDEGQLIHETCTKGTTTVADDGADEAGTVSDTAEGGTDPTTDSAEGGSTDPSSASADDGATDPSTASGDDGATTAEPTTADDGTDSGPSTAGDETGGGEADDGGPSTSPSTTANDSDGSSGEGDSGGGDDDKGGCSIDPQGSDAPLGLALTLAIALGLRRRRR